jgi:plasmid stabilization system protein ParE
MPARLIYSSAAGQDLADAVGWLSQPGAGTRAHLKLAALVDEIERLPDNPLLYREDFDEPGSRLAIVQGYAVRFRPSVGGTIFVERIFAPGRRRTTL